ncbi:hypothetical protein SUDANB6_01384 [Streptomyces sp. enrichment culture]|uniref:hypothetical protein n=1 Tax=Streptomyces sp. enrichment culture TaxID=1795815 RepID=UPI003F554BCF
MSGTSAVLRPPADAARPVRHCDAPAPGGLPGSLDRLLPTVAVTGRPGAGLLRPVPAGAAPCPEAGTTAVAGRRIHSTATGRTGGPDGPVAVRAGAVFVGAGVDHSAEHGREEEIRAAMDDPDRVRRARASEVNP